jgi:hypothetical protein
MSGQWPPEWEDSDTGLPDEWTLDDAGLDPEALEVTAFLASTSSPVLPTSFEARISAAIAAEASARADGTASAGAGMASAETGDAETTDRSSPLVFSPAAAASGSASAAKHRRRRTSSASRGAGGRSGPRGSRPDGRRRLRLPSAAVTAPLLVLAILAGFGYLFTQISGSSSSSQSSVASGTMSSASAPAAAPAAASGHSIAAGRNASGFGPQYDTKSGKNVTFVLTASGTSYKGATLASQVRAQLGAQNEVTPAATAPGGSIPSVEASASASVPAPAATPASLKGCVSALTGGVSPSLVDQASYDGTPAYIIAVPDHAWVVRRDCTAADVQEITSVSLSG